MEGMGPPAKGDVEPMRSSQNAEHRHRNPGEPMNHDRFAPASTVEHPTARPRLHAGHCPIRADQHGLSLVELCIALAILAVVLGFGLLSPGSLNAGRLGTIASTLQAHLNLARSEAIKRGQRTAICKSSDGQSCATTGNWSQGWIVFEDSNNNAQLDPQERVIQVSGKLPADIVFQGNLTVSRYISFRPDGSPAHASGAFQAGTLLLCQKSATATRSHSLIMSATGRTRLQSDPAASCA